MAFRRTGPVEQVADVQTNTATFNENITNMPKNIVAEKDPAVYKKAAKDFLSMDSDAFLKKHPDLSQSVAMFKVVDSETHMHGGVNAGRAISGTEASDYVRKSVRENIAEDIADAKHPIIDLAKSKDMAAAFRNGVDEAFTPGDIAKIRASTIVLYPQLDQAFDHYDAMQKVTHTMPESVAETIAKGDIPQMTPALQQAVDRAEQQHEISR